MATLATSRPGTGRRSSRRPVSWKFLMYSSAVDGLAPAARYRSARPANTKPTRGATTCRAIGARCRWSNRATRVTASKPATPSPVTAPVNAANSTTWRVWRPNANTSSR